jgi:TolB-like protein/Tfp pilus assembly protein PilF
VVGARTATISTLAFVPLENATKDQALNYYAAGLTEGLATQLGAATGVRVIAPASAARVAGSTDTLAAVARRLGAGAIVTGRLRYNQDRIAVDARLADASGRVLWSDTFERAPAQALALQADLVRALAAAVRLVIRPDAAGRLATVRAVSPQAYEAYLKGRYEWNQRTPASLRRAMALFTTATELDPTYAPALAALADCYNQLGTVLVGSGSPRELRPRAAAAAIRALQIDPYSAEAHAALGYVHHYEWRWSDAEREFRQAIELNPSYPWAHVWYANLLMSRGRMDEAIARIQTARDLDPFSLIVNTNVGWILMTAHRPNEAIVQLRWTLELDSSYVQARARLSGALLDAGRYQEARAQAVRVVQMTNRAPHMVTILARVEARLGRPAATRALLAELLARAQAGSYVPPASIAWIYADLNEPDSAIAWMNRAFDEHSNAIAYLAVDAVRSSVRDDPRFQALLVRAGLR